MTAISITPKQANDLLDHHISTAMPCMIWGPPGVGKSQIVKQAARRAFESKAGGARWFIDLRGPTIDALDIRGLPTVENMITVFAQSGLLPIAGRDADHGAIFLDELPGADPMVQKAFLELSLDRTVGEYCLPDGWVIIAAGNRMQDRAGVGRFNSALADRFSHYTMTVNVNAWSEHAVTSGWPAELVAFIRFRDELLHDFDPDRLVNATPRAWEMAIPAFTSGLAPDLELIALAGTVGEGPAAEFIGFLKIWRSLPSPDAILMNPAGSSVPDDAATRYALTGALARKVTSQTMSNLVQYLKRLPAEFGVMCMADIKARDESLMSTPAFIEWVSLNSDVYL